MCCKACLKCSTYYPCRSMLGAEVGSAVTNSTQQHSMSAAADDWSVRVTYRHFVHELWCNIVVPNDVVEGARLPAPQTTISNVSLVT